MDIYPNLNISGGNDFGHKKDDGRVVSRAEDGTPRAQILFSQLQHTFSIKHILLDEDQRAIIERFYDRNSALEFIYDCQFNKKRYQCIYVISPQPIDHVGLSCSMEVEFTGYELMN